MKGVLFCSICKTQHNTCVL